MATPTAQRRPFRWPGPPVVALVVALVFTAIVVGAPSVRFAYDNLALHVALETTEGLVAVLVAVLCAARFRRTLARTDLLLAAAFSTLAATNLLVSALPIIAVGARDADLATWLALALRLVGAGGLCASALLPARRTVSPPVARVAVTVLALALGSLGLALLATAHLDEPIDPTLSPSSSTRPDVVGHPLVVGALAAGLVLHAASAIGFGVQAARRRDDLLDWLAAGTAVGAVARVHYLLFPSLYSNWVYTGDLLRAASYGLFLGGAARALMGHWAATAQVAAYDERRRLARELHDGLVQELSFIRSQTAGQASVNEPMVHHIAAAAERALAESRLALDALGGTDAPLPEAIRATAEAAALRWGARVEVNVDGVPALPVEVRHALLRVVREAATNAVRHGTASTVQVDLTRSNGSIHLRVTDDGVGFDPAEVDLGFGLRSMQERVESLGGALDVRARVGVGADVVATIPVATP